jgi:hypothetical protein
MQGLVMVKRDHEGNNEDSLFDTNFVRFNKLLHKLPKLWPPIISKH